MHIDSHIWPAISKLLQLCGGKPEVLRMKYAEKHGSTSSCKHFLHVHKGNLVHFSYLCWDCVWLYTGAKKQICSPCVALKTLITICGGEL